MGGLQSHRHNELRDITEQMLREACRNVTVEPTLQQLSGEVFRGHSTSTDVGARLDVAADDFWGSGHTL